MPEPNYYSNLGQKGVYVKPQGNPPWFKIGAEISFYNLKGEKRYGLIRGLSETNITIQDVQDRKTHTLKLQEDL